MAVLVLLLSALVPPASAQTPLSDDASLSALSLTGVWRGTGPFTTEPIATMSFTLVSVATTRQVAENTAAGTDIGAPVTAAGTSGTVAYTLAGTDAASFDIDAATGQLQTKAALDYETRSSYEVTVTATDSNGAIDTAVTIEVTNVDEPGSLSFFPASPQVGTVLRGTVSDPDGIDRTAWAATWKWERSSDQSSWEEITHFGPPMRTFGEAYQVSRRTNYAPATADLGKYLRATVTYIDQEGPGKTVERVLSQVVAAGASPEITVVELVSGLTHPWGLAFAPDGTMLFTERGRGLNSRLPDGTLQTVIADLSGLGGRGERGMLGLVVDPDFATNRRFYTCSGHTGPSEMQVTAWSIDDTYTEAVRIADPLVGGIPIGPVRNGCRLRFGPEGFLWVTTGDAEMGTSAQDLASLGGKVLRVDPSTGAGAPTNPFAQAPLVYTYGHRNPQGLARRPGTDQMWSVEHGTSQDDEINLLVSGGNYGWHPVAQSMTDLEEFPRAIEAEWSSGYATAATSGGIFLEGSDWGEWEGRLAVATLKTRSLRIFEFTAAGTFVSQVIVPELDGAYGRLRTPMLDPGGVLYLTSSQGGGADRILKVVPSRPPAFAAATDTREVAENNSTSTVVATATATDPDGERLTYTLSGRDAAAFTVANPAAGGLRADVQFDHEARRSYEVVVTATDPYGLSDSVTLTITITDVDEAPEVTGPAQVTIEENSIDYVGRYTATDPEGESTVWDDLSGPDRSHFELTAAGDLSFTATPDFEARDDDNRDNRYEVTLGASDDSPLTGALGVTVTVENVNEAPVVLGAGIESFTENGTGDVATFTASDPDDGDTVSWDLAGPDAGLFSIDGGVLRFKSPPDFEAPADRDGDNEHQVTVEATDGVHTSRLAVTVTVTDVHENRPQPVSIGGGPGGPAEPPELPDASELFGDVEDDAYYEAAVAWMVQQEITVGCTSEPLRYCPERPVTRAQMASFLARALDLDTPAQRAGFADVDPSSVHAAAIEALFGAHITVGCASEPLRYCPERPVTRAQMASFLARALDLDTPAQRAGFADVDPSSVHAAAIEALFGAHITVGCASEPLRYCPERPVTRAQMAAFLYRARNLIAAANSNTN